jgi:phosphoribosylcarboxyaminoimidazole (NCAIR) mutase
MLVLEPANAALAAAKMLALAEPALVERIAEPPTGKSPQTGDS